MIFLRPWLLLLIFVPIVFKMFRERVSTSSDWHKVIDKRLLPYLLIPGTSTTAAKRNLYQTILWAILSIAAAGPAWDKMPIPSQTEQPGTIIVMELSPAMAEPWLTQAKRKIQDTLTELKGEQVGLVIYDRFGYTAGPLTFETDIIRDMVPYLSQSLLPEAQSNPVVGFEQADQLLQNAGIKSGRILFLTSGAFIPQNMAEIVKKYDHKIGILGVGPLEAHPVPLPQGGFLLDDNQRPVMVQLNPQQLSEIGVYQPLTPDKTDIQTLLDQTEPSPEDSRHDVLEGVSLWQDRGGLLVLLCLPFFALIFRKGIVILLLVGIGFSANASLWLRPDQEEYNRQIDAVRDYRRERYKMAEKVFRSGKNIDDLYNAGNALAFQEKIPEAIETYKKVLDKNPQHADARYNKEYLERQLEQDPPPPPPEENQPQEQQNQPEQQPEQQQPQDQQKEPEKQQEQPEQQQESEKQQEQQEQQLDQLKDLMNQENSLKQEQQKEIEKQLQPKDKEENKREKQLQQLKQQLQQEQKNTKEKQKEVDRMKQQPAEAMKQQLKQMEQKISQELKQKQWKARSINEEKEPDLKKLKTLMQRENEVKQKEVELLKQIIQEKQQEQPQEKKEAEKPQSSQDQENTQQENSVSEDVFNEEAQKILNRLENDEGNVLRYRIRQQYLRHTGG